MAELDSHEVDGDRRRAQLAMLHARVLGMILLGLIGVLLYYFRSSVVLQVLSVAGTLSVLCAWYLYDLLELCDD